MSAGRQSPATATGDCHRRQPIVLVVALSHLLLMRPPHHPRIPAKPSSHRTPSPTALLIHPPKRHEHHLPFTPSLPSWTHLTADPSRGSPLPRRHVSRDPPMAMVSRYPRRIPRVEPSTITAPLMDASRASVCVECHGYAVWNSLFG